MTLAFAILQPQRFNRASADGNVTLIDDVGRMLAFLIEDAADEGPVAAALLEALEAMGPRLQAELEARFRSVAARLRIRAQALVSSLTALGDDIAAVGDDATRALDLAKRLLDLLTEGLDTLTYPGLRAQVQFAVDLLETDLGLSASFVEAQILAFLNDAAARVAALDAGGDAAVRRQRRSCAATLRRLARFLEATFHFPGFDVDGLARALYDLLAQAGVQQVVAQIRCAMGEFEGAVASARALRDVAAAAGTIGGSVGAAALVELTGKPVFAWYPSWLLGDEDLPLIGLGELTNAARLIVTIRDSELEVPRWLREQFSTAQLAAFAGVAVGTEPTDEQKLIVLAVLNQLIQGPLIYDSERFPTLTLPEGLLSDQHDAIEDNDVLLANRRFICHAFQSDVNDADGGVRRWIGRTFLGLIDWPRNQVSVSADRRFVLCDDMPLCMGENLKWNDAPLFSKSERGQTYWIFRHISPAVCEGFAHHLAWPTTLGKAVWHLVNTILDQPGHRVGSAIAVSLEFTEALNQLIFGRPVHGYELGGFGNWLSSGAVGPRAVSILAGSFQGFHTKATGDNIFLFWLTMLAGDVIRTAGPSSLLGPVREIVLGVLTLVNFGGPRDGPSTLPASPAQNHLKQGPINSLVNSLFGLWLISYYKREDHAVEIWSAGGIGDRRERAFALWLGGGIGMGIAAGVTTTLVAQIMAWAEDWGRFGKTVGFASLTMVLQFWFLEYLQKEGDTDGGTYNPRGPRAFKGYPNKDSSPYRLPFPSGEALYCGQGNQGLWSHNDIANIGSSQQTYAYDFGHDHEQGICASRGGIVWAFTEGNADNNTSTPNTITILHDVNDPEHDDPFGTGPVTTYTRYLHGAQNGVTNAFASRGLPPPTQESSSPGAGTRVNRGDVIMLADDTGKSFHSHLHMDVMMDTSGGVVAAGAATGPGNVGIPFVFKEVRGEGRPLNLTWYESENG